MRHFSRAQTLAVLAFVAFSAVTLSACDSDRRDAGTQGDTVVTEVPSSQTTLAEMDTDTDLNDMETDVPVDTAADATSSTTESASTIDRAPTGAVAAVPATRSEITDDANDELIIVDRNETSSDTIDDDVDYSSDDMLDEDMDGSEDIVFEEDIYLDEDRDPASVLPSENIDGAAALTRRADLGLDYEPSSVGIPIMGSMSLTGMDRSHAQFSETSPVFTDKTIAKFQPVAVFVPVATIDFDDYTYADRSEFRTVMHNYVDQIEADKVNISGEERALAGATPAAFKRQMKDLSQLENRVVDRINDANKVDASEWSSYKDDLRSQISELENSYMEIRTAMQD